MTVMEFFGCTFIAFGPPFALFVFTIARDPLRIIVLIARCVYYTVCFYIYFIWMVALMCKVIFIWSYSKISFKDIWTVLNMFVVYHVYWLKTFSFQWIFLVAITFGILNIVVCCSSTQRAVGFWSGFLSSVSRSI